MKRRMLPLFYVHPGTTRVRVPHVDGRSVAFFGLVLFVAALAGGLYLRQASDVATLAHEIRELQRQKEWVQREITVLRAEVAIAGSLRRTRELGQHLGYTLLSAADTTRQLRVQYQVEAMSSAQATPTAMGVASEPAGVLAAPAKGASKLIERLLTQFQEWLDTSVEQTSPTSSSPSATW